jgi:hypothetical protein
VVVLAEDGNRIRWDHANRVALRVRCTAESTRAAAVNRPRDGCDGLFCDFNVSEKCGQSHVTIFKAARLSTKNVGELNSAQQQHTAESVHVRSSVPHPRLTRPGVLLILDNDAN